MKKFIGTWISIFLISIAVSAQSIPNGGFENWTNMGTYSNPDNWATLNAYTAPMGIATCTKGTPAPVGSSYLKLISRSVLGFGVIPAIAVCGTIDTSSMEPLAGFAFNTRPQNFTGKWQYMVFGNDPGYMAATLTKWNTQQMKRDTIAYLYYELPGMVMSWGNFSRPLTYISGDYPDSAIIVVSASGQVPFSQDYLYLDNLAFTGSVAGIDETNPEFVVSVFPNPASDMIQVNFNQASFQDAVIDIYDITGKHLISNTIQGNTNACKVNIAELETGSYLIRLSNGKQFAFRSFIKQ
jgi:hypothetical protein